VSTRAIAAATIGFFAALLQLVSGLVSVPVALACGALLAVACLLIVRYVEVELEAMGTVLLPTLASAAGVSCLAFVPGRQSPVLWAAPLLACAGAATLVWIRQMSEERCALCASRLGRRVAFDCPRCLLRVCDGCWVFEYRRCRLCEQNHVPVFTDSKWWDRELGPRLTFGRCQLCLTPVDTEGTDLRACGDCGRPQCRNCWDASNGECRRCGWIVRDLPPALRPYVTSADREASGHPDVPWPH
jgi:hypothetical protein